MKKITTEELKNMSHQEGLILQGCGGDLQEWIDGINGILREQGILLDGKPLDDVAGICGAETRNSRTNLPCVDVAQI